MYRIYFYKDRRGCSPVYEYMLELSKSGSKEALIKSNSIGRCLYLLRHDGLSVGEPYMKHLDGDIWSFVR